MVTINVERLGDDVQGVIAAAQIGDVLVMDQGKIVAVVSKPRPIHDAAYWRERDALLASVVAAPDWDSTVAVSQDRDR